MHQTKQAMLYTTTPCQVCVRQPLRFMAVAPKTGPRYGSQVPLGGSPPSPSWKAPVPVHLRLLNWGQVRLSDLPMQLYSVLLNGRRDDEPAVNGGQAQILLRKGLLFCEQDVAWVHLHQVLADFQLL